ncbi:nitrate reductase molybdenum cofactor assembly chaperone [Janibacter sp. GXQ6167]|uniref:nitrate reductase molybdenum cofactor assembly chaperone n=1 Tax=Janibacter sp. GXQ6167 TaxID=3240791 RepID=UPI003525D728
MIPWRRHRRRTPALSERELADTWQLVSVLLDYPDEALLARLPDLRAVAAQLPGEVAQPLTAFLDHLAGSDLTDLQSEYVDTFDVTRRCALHLTYFLHGDTRKRGVALVQFKQTYRHAGVVLGDEDSELPDHLSVVLEFGASVDRDAAWKLLNDHRVGIELLRAALDDRSSPWRHVIAALRATLPPLEGDDHEALARLIAEGPPQEEVGIDQAPYAMDPALYEPGGASSGVTDLGQTIPVGASR